MSTEKPNLDIEALAKQELLREAKRGAERSSTMGPQGWLKPKVASINKRFLSRTLKSASVDYRRLNSLSQTTKSESAESRKRAQNSEIEDSDKKEDGSCSAKRSNPETTVHYSKRTSAKKRR